MSRQTLWIAVAVAAWVAFGCWYVVARRDCDGTLVRGVFWFECIHTVH